MIFGRYQVINNVTGFHKLLYSFVFIFFTYGVNFGQEQNLKPKHKLLWSELHKKTESDKKKEEYTVSANQVLVIDQSPVNIGRLIIQGTVIVSDKQDLELKLDHLEIDGGIFKVGDSMDEFKSKLTLKFPKTDEASIIIKNEGQLLLYGNQKKSFTGQEIISIPEFNNLPKRNISIQSYSQSSILSTENAKNIYISGVSFHHNSEYHGQFAINLYGKSKVSTIITDCIIHSENSGGLYLDKTKLILKNSILIGVNQNTILCSPSGVGENNTINKNIIFHSSEKGTAAVKIQNPYQQITNNIIYSENKSDGLTYTTQKNYKDFIWQKPAKHFVLKNNKIKHLSQKDISYNSTGLYLDNFKHSGIWRTMNNEINNYSIGSILKNKNTVLQEYYWKNNIIGCLPGSAYIQKCLITADSSKHKLQIGLLVSDTIGISAPKIESLHIKNYDTGIQFYGNVENENYFKKITYDNVDKPAHFLHLSDTSYIYDIDSSLLGTDQKPETSKMIHQDHVMHQSMDHTHNNKEKKPKGNYFIAKNSFWNTNNNNSLTDQPVISKIPEWKLGELTISTGFGLDDPIHEHWKTFRDIKLTNTKNKKVLSRKKAENRESFTITANTTYSLNYNLSASDFYDISLEWDAPKDTWIILNISYKHSNSYALHPFGSLIEPSPSKDLLLHSEKTSYFIDEVSNTATIKIYNTNNHNELVLYSSDILTEISYQGNRIPLQIKTDTNANKVIISYKIPDISIKSKLVLTDSYGNPLETLFDGISENEIVKGIVDIDKHQVNKTVLFYFLTIDGQTHKGPVYAN
ncbi:G8 domain-containing protein [uncultured Aquimarina sp.]|uniref:G8 domain-containing protein n=1 Tax=uncultured Aquimarina sp. TaxID=575652 RepID=UPI002628E83F|nr:G8 domain-containing protein [uncultured Aquimarina sp.]